MVKILKFLITGIILVTVGVVGGAYLLPHEIYVIRSKIISSPIAQVFNQLADLAQEPHWANWQALDKNIKYKVSGPKGQGQVLTWASANYLVGAGKMTVISFKPNQEIGYLVDLGEMGQAETRWHITPINAQETKLSYSFKQQSTSVLDRWLNLFLPGILEKDFNQRLERVGASLSQQTEFEKPPSANPPPLFQAAPQSVPAR